MRPLLNKTTRPFLIYVLIVLLISVPVYYVVVDAIWKMELDEHNHIIAQKSAAGLTQLQLPDDKLQESIELWNSIQPGTNIEPLLAGTSEKDSLYTIEKGNNFSREAEVDRFRCLQTVVYINNKPYRFTVETNIEESEETIAVLAIVTIFFFAVIVIGLLVLNSRLSKTVWQPFRNTLDKLKGFNLNNQANIAFEKTDTTEFEELNTSLQTLIAQNISVYKTQKEFTENASHELQTPLAILKNKLDILLQSEDLTEGQYQLAEDMYTALSRSSRINKNLLLLAKIENSQFDKSEKMQVDELLNQVIDMLQEHFDSKQIVLETNIAENIQLNGNIGLTEILISNLLLNAIRHTTEGGRVYIDLSSAALTVKNSGDEPLDENKLFHRFARNSVNNSGSGLGLSIIKEISKYQQWKAGYRFEPGFHLFEIRFQ